MKKIFLFSLLAISLGATAQNFPGSVTGAGPGDFKGTRINPYGVITNATADTIKGSIGGVSYEKLGINLVVTKSAGTMAGKARLFGAAIDSAGAYTQIDSVVLTNVAIQTKQWSITQPLYKYFMVIQSEATTVTGRQRVFLTGIKR